MLTRFGQSHQTHFSWGYLAFCFLWQMVNEKCTQSVNSLPQNIKSPALSVVRYDLQRTSNQSLRFLSRSLTPLPPVRSESLHRSRGWVLWFLSMVLNSASDWGCLHMAMGFLLWCINQYSVTSCNFHGQIWLWQTQYLSWHVAWILRSHKWLIFSGSLQSWKLWPHILCWSQGVA